MFSPSYIHTCTHTQRNVLNMIHFPKSDQIPKQNLKIWWQNPFFGQAKNLSTPSSWAYACFLVDTFLKCMERKKSLKYYFENQYWTIFLFPNSLKQVFYGFELPAPLHFGDKCYKIETYACFTDLIYLCDLTCIIIAKWANISLISSFVTLKIESLKICATML